MFLPPYYAGAYFNGPYFADGQVGGALGDGYTFALPAVAFPRVATAAIEVTLLPAGSGAARAIDFIPTDFNDGGTFSPASAVLPAGGTGVSFSYTPASIGTKLIYIVNDGGLFGPDPLPLPVVHMAVVDGPGAAPQQPQAQPWTAQSLQTLAGPVPRDFVPPSRDATAETPQAPNDAGITRVPY